MIFGFQFPQNQLYMNHEGLQPQSKQCRSSSRFQYHLSSNLCLLLPQSRDGSKKANHQNQSNTTVQNIIKTYLTSLNGNLQFTILKSDKLDCKLRTTEEAWELYVGGQDLLVTLWTGLLPLPENS